MADVEKAIEQIKGAIATGNVRIPVAAEKVFPIGLKDTEKYEFLYVNLAGGFDEATYEDKPEWNHQGGFILAWGARNIGFGELTFKVVGGKKDAETGEIIGGRTVCDSECMGKEFVRAALAHFVNSVEVK